MIWIWIPVALIAFWGYAYLRACLIALTSSSMAVVYVMPTEAGPVTVRANTVNVSLETNTIHATGITMREPNGTLMASADEASVVGAIPYVSKREPVINGSVRGVYGRIERLQNGQLKFLRYLPTPTKQKQEVPYALDIRSVRLDLVDYGSATPWKDTALIPRLKVDGVGSRMVASGRVDLLKNGNLTAEVRNDPDAGLTIDGKATKLELTQLLRHVAATRDVERLPVLRNVSADYLVVDGPMRFFLPLKGTAAFEMNVVADARNVVYNKTYSAPLAHFKGLFTHAGMKGSFTASGNGMNVVYTGGVSWTKQSALGGSLTASVQNSATAPIWIRKYLPANTGIRGASFVGWLSYAGNGEAKLDGQFSAAEAAYGADRVIAPRGELDASKGRVAIFLQSGTWNASPVRGALELNPVSKGITGVVSADNLSIPRLASTYGVNNVSGIASAQALISGTISAPIVEVRATGNAATRVASRNLDLGRVVATGTYRGKNFDLHRLTVLGPNGVLTAKGGWTPGPNGLALDLIGSGVPLKLVSSNVEGTASFVGHVGGQAQNPLATGTVEVFDAKIGDQEIPLAAANFRANRDRVVADNLVAIQHAGKARGSVALNLHDNSITGDVSATNIRLRDYLGQDAEGVVNVPTAKISGTLQHIKVSGDFEGRSLVARGVAVDSLTGHVDVDGTHASLTNAVASLETGKVAASGQYDFSSKGGTVTAQATGLDLGALIAEVSDRAAFQGQLNGTFTGTIANNKLTDAKGQGDIQDLRVNNVLIGTGSYEVAGTNGIFTGSSTIGQVERYFALNDFRYDSNAKTLQADVLAHNIALDNILAATGRYVASKNDPPDVQKAALFVLPGTVSDKLQTLKGNLDAEVSISGPTSNPDLNVQQLQVNNLEIDGRQSGQLNAQATRKSNLWDIAALNWTGGPGQLSAHGTIDEHGETNVDGDLNNVNAQWLSLFQPNLARFQGKTDLSFTVSGATQSPIVQSSFHYKEEPVTGAAATEHRQVDVLATVQEGRIDAAGTYYYNGFTGPIVASLPFQYPFTIPQDQELSAKLTLPSRKIADLKDLFPWIDANKTDGTISGVATVSGTPSALKVNGGLHAASDHFGTTFLQGSLNNLVADVNFDGTSLNLKGSATGSDGGTISLNDSRVNLGNLADAVSQSFDLLLSNPLSGSLSLDNFHLRQKSSNNGSLDTILNGTINAGGTLKTPVITGNLTAEGGNVTIPSEFPAGSVAVVPVINPQFDVGLAIIQPISLKSATANFNIDGTGHLGGTLALPDLNAGLVVEKGSIRLPNARITIDPGGTIQINYLATPYGAANATANVDLTGRTALTASPYGDVVTRYDVTLGIRGDLLVQNGLAITATADPPDLSSSRILALLGQGDLFTGGPGSSSAYNTNRQIQTALFTALPVLLDPITQQLANQLGLDYVSFEYNTLEQITVTAAKSLGKNFVISGRRQLSSPLPGRKQSYDYRISYRLPIKGKLFRNLNFSVGSDQDRPWKISLEYGFRF